MAEQLNLTAASGPTTPLWRVKTIVLDRGLTSAGGPIISVPSQSMIRVWLIGENAREFPGQWMASAADADIIALNKANLSGIGGTLEKRTLNRMIALYPELAGTISGSPD